LVTTFFPVLGASPHNALAQSEVLRLSAISERLVAELQAAVKDALNILAGAAGQAANEALKETVMAAVASKLEEHQDSHAPVRPHQLLLL
jgi:hypothetical protein